MVHKSELEASIARTARQEPQSFEVLADLAEERGADESACLAIRRLPQEAAAVREALARLTAAACKVRQLQVNQYGDWTVFLDHDPRPLELQDPAHRRGHSPALEAVMAEHDLCFPALDAFGACLDFSVVESMRTATGTVLQVRFANK